MKRQKFGELNGKVIDKYTLSNGLLEADIITYGGAVNALRFKGVDLVLGYNTVAEYAANGGYVGALIGRVGNRIGQGKFTINGVNYKASINDGDNSLHGGLHGFDSKIWKATVEGEKLILSLESADMEEGYPGNLKVCVTYSITAENGLKIEYTAVSDKDTVVNLTNHSYFNLNGENCSDIYETLIQIDADKITPVDGGLIPFNTFMDVEGTPFDFRKFKKIGLDIENSHEQIKLCGGYDINYALNGKGFRKIATAVGDKTGIEMQVYTDAVGVQFYTGNFLTNVKGKTGRYDRRCAFCLETQYYPNAINCDKYPSPLLKKGEKYSTVTEYRFK